MDSEKTVGTILREARLAKRLSLADAEKGTSIRSRYLEALERDEYDKTPGEVFLKGMIRNYGNFLGLNGPELVQLYKASAAGVAKEAVKSAGIREVDKVKLNIQLKNPRDVGSGTGKLELPKLPSFDMRQVLAGIPGIDDSVIQEAMDNTLNVIKLVSKVSLPDSVEYRQIQVGAATVDAARKTADSIYNAIKAGGDFEAIAKKYGQEGKSMWMTGAMYEGAQGIDADTKSFIEALVNTGAGEVKNLQFSQGNVVLQIVNRKAMTDKYVAAVVKHTIDFSKGTYSAAYNKFSQFVSENQTLEALEKNAAKYGFKVAERRNMVNSEHNVAGIRATREAMKWVFDAKTKKGDVSPLYECGNNDHLLVVALTGVHPVGVRDLEDVKDIVKQEVLIDKKFEMLEKKLAGANSIAAAKAKGAQVTDVKQVTFAAPAFIPTLGASEPALSGVVAATKQGQFCKRVIKGNAGAYMVQVVKKAKRQGVKYDQKAVETQLQQQALQAAGMFMRELNMKAKVVDNRYLFF